MFSKYFLRALALARLALQFGKVHRATFHEDGVRPETDTDHTVMLSLIACDLAAYINRLGGTYWLNVGLVAQLALIHDLEEAYAGDTSTLDISAKGREAKELREKVARERLQKEFGGEGSWLMEVMALYQKQECPEARYIKVLDKVLPKFTHIFNKGVTPQASNMDYATFAAIHMRQYDELSQKYRDVHPEVFDLLWQAMRESEKSFPGSQEGR